MATYLESLIREYRKTPEYITESAMLDFLHSIEIRLEASGINKSEFARRAKLDPAQVSRIFRGDHNLTIRTMGKVAAAFECRLEIRMPIITVKSVGLPFLFSASTSKITENFNNKVSFDDSFVHAAV